MKDKICNVLTVVYAALILVSLFGGLLPIIPFIVALIIGGEVGASMSVFIYQQYYPWVAVLASLAVVLGLVNMYLSKQITFSLPSWMRTKSTQNAKSDSEASSSAPQHGTNEANQQ